MNPGVNMLPLTRAPVPDATLLIRGAHVLDPRSDLDGPHDVLVRDGEIAQLGAPGSLQAPAGGLLRVGFSMYNTAEEAMRLIAVIRRP